MKYYIFLLSLVISVAFLNTSIYPQDLLEHVLNPSCGTKSSAEFCINQYSITVILIKQNHFKVKHSGIHYFELNSTDAELSSGIYFYRMHAKSSAGEFVETRKLVILK